MENNLGQHRDYRCSLAESLSRGQVVLVKDINPDNSSNPNNLTEFDGKLYYTADDGENGNELWVSDGTTEGTQLLVNIRPDLDDEYYNPYVNYAPQDLTVFNDKLYFTLNDGENGRELWVTDGTTESTQIIKDIYPGSGNYFGFSYNDYAPSGFTEFDGKLYFTANDEENSRELWVTDGTTQGTQMVTDIFPENFYYYSYIDYAPQDLTEFDGKLYFSADDGENGRELWVSDGTNEGTQLLVDINPGNYDSDPNGFIEFEGKLYFSANGGENGEELWVSDGTNEGTQLLADINSGFSYGYPDSSAIDNLTEFDGKLYFSADDGKNGRELWVSDGTNEGTQLLADIRPNVSGDYYDSGSYPYSLTVFNDKLYFTANDGENGEELWVTDGTTQGTQLAADIEPGINDSIEGYSSNPRNLTEFNDRLYFVASDGEDRRELWVSDGTTQGTQLLADVLPDGNDDNFFYELTEFDDKLYFAADDGENGNELWVSDGTAEGTQLLVDIDPGIDSYGYAYSSSPENFTVFNDKLYFSANGNELWVSDGTANGTQLVADINPGEGSPSDNFTVFDDKLYFSADDGENGNELWVSDGTTQGTQLLADISLGGDGYGYYYSSYPRDLTELNGKLYFGADDQLWVTDGTTEGTQLVADTNLNNDGYIDGFSPGGFTVLNDKLYFSANDGENGNELWVSDGTTEGTQLLVDIRPNINDNNYSNGSNPSYFTEFNGKLYFSANDGENGEELWVTDGTTEGTQLLVDIDPSSNENNYFNGSEPRGLTVFDDKLYFSADDGENGEELWVSDGTVEGTQLVVDLRPGVDVRIFADGSNPMDLTVVGDELFFSIGELYKLTLDDLSNTINGNNGGNNFVGTDDADLINGLGNNDTINGGAGDDTINGGDGRDILNGEAGFDSLTGGIGKDTLDGGADNDILRGGERQDYLIGGTGDDRLFGDGSRDTLDGGLGNDTLTGGDRGDTFVLRSGEGRDLILDFQLRVDSIGLAGGLEFTDLTLAGNVIQAGNEVLAIVDGMETENLTSDNFIII